MRVGVYAISKNESKHVDEWLRCVSEADVVVVLDTGSEDDTVDKLYAGGAVVSVWPGEFRFDKARNIALETARNCDVDIWVSLDLDEMPEKGWRKKLEAAATDGSQGWRITIDNGSYTFQNTRCHRPDGWEWKHACHEVLCGPGPTGDAGFKVIHKQDRSKPRSYLPLLKIDAEENPHDGRAWHYLGREYMYLGEWEEAIKALDQAISWDYWNEQRSFSMIYMSRCQWHLGKPLVRNYAVQAVYTFGSREAWVNLAWVLNQDNDPSATIAAQNALKIKRQGLYPSEPSAWSRETENWLRKLAEA